MRSKTSKTYREDNVDKVTEVEEDDNASKTRLPKIINHDETLVKLHEFIQTYLEKSQQNFSLLKETIYQRAALVTHKPITTREDFEEHIQNPYYGQSTVTSGPNRE